MIRRPSRLTPFPYTTSFWCASYSVTRTWTALDACGNSSTASQTINVEDNTEPVIATLPSTSSIGWPFTPVFAQATAIDACGSTFTLSSNDVTTAHCGASYSVTRTWTALKSVVKGKRADHRGSGIIKKKPVIAALPPTSTIECPATPVFAQA